MISSNCEELAAKIIANNLSMFEKDLSKSIKSVELLYVAKAISNSEEDKKEIDRILEKYDINFQEGEKEAIFFRTIVKSLSTKGYVGYLSAEKLYDLIIKGNYGELDAGMLSLSYYKIIEIESAERLWKPLLSSIGKEKLYAEYQQTIEMIEDIKKRGKFANKYKRVFNNLTKDEPTLMLGDLEILFGGIKNEHMEKMVFKHLYEELCTLLTESGINAFSNGQILEWYCSKNRKKFRNPPAHTQYLKLKVALECKEYVELQIANMSLWIK